MESCDFVNEEFPTEIQQFTKMQQTLVKLKVAIFYKRCWQMRLFYLLVFIFRHFLIFFQIKFLFYNFQFSLNTHSD